MAAASTLCENPLIYGTFRSVTGFQRGAATRECCIAAHFCAGDRHHCATAQPSSPIGGGGFGIPHVAALMLLPVCLKIRPLPSERAGCRCPDQREPPSPCTWPWHVDC